MDQTTIRENLPETVPYDKNNSTKTEIPKIDTQMDQASETLFLILHLLVSIFILFGNCATIYAIAKNRALRTLSNSLIIFLSVPDLMVGVSVPVCGTIEHSHILHITFEFKIPCITCKAMYVGTILSSMSTLASIAVDRFIAVNYSLEYSSMTSNNRMIILNSVLWLFAFTTAILVPVTTTWELGVLCLLDNIVPSWLLYSIGGQMCFLIVVTTLLYVQIFLTARKQKRKIDQQSKQPIDKNKSLNQVHKSTMMMALILGLFLLCLTPYLIIAYTNAALQDTPHQGHLVVLLRLTSLLAFSNSGMKPIIYCWKNGQFRREYKRIFSTCLHGQS